MASHKKYQRIASYMKHYIANKLRLATTLKNNTGIPAMKVVFFIYKIPFFEFQSKDNALDI